jgi:hypothetical protein
VAVAVFARPKVKISSANTVNRRIIKSKQLIRPLLPQKTFNGYSDFIVLFFAVFVVGSVYENFLHGLRQRRLMAFTAKSSASPQENILMSINPDTSEPECWFDA